VLLSISSLSDTVTHEKDGELRIQGTTSWREHLMNALIVFRNTSLCNPPSPRIRKYNP